MRWLMASRRRWVTIQAIWCCIVSLIAAAVTGNENWPMNIPLALAGGAFIGWLSWPGYRAPRDGAR